MVTHNKSQFADDKSSLKGAWLGSRDSFTNFWARHIFGVDEARHVNFGMQTEYYHIHVCVKMSQYGGHMTSYNLGGISANLSEMAQDRDIVTMEY